MKSRRFLSVACPCGAKIGQPCESPLIGEREHYARRKAYYDVRLPEVKCPTCLAFPGDQCILASGRTAKQPHAKRVELAKFKLAKAEEAKLEKTKP